MKFGACRYVSCHPEIFLGGEALFKGSPEENSRELSEKGSLKVILFQCVEAFRLLRDIKSSLTLFSKSQLNEGRENCACKGKEVIIKVVATNDEGYFSLLYLPGSTLRE